VIGFHNAAALGAETAIAHRRRHEVGERIFALRYLNVVGFPESEGVNRRAEVGSARLAMAVAHAFRHPRDFDLHRAAIAFSRISVGHGVIVGASPSLGNNIGFLEGRALRRLRESWESLAELGPPNFPRGRFFCSRFAVRSVRASGLASTSPTGRRLQRAISRAPVRRAQCIRRGAD
jgi:hypothetical protein